jgi:hypothetical protein
MVGFLTLLLGSLHQGNTFRTLALKLSGSCSILHACLARRARSPSQSSSYVSSAYRVLVACWKGMLVVEAVDDVVLPALSLELEVPQPGN